MGLMNAKFIALLGVDWDDNALRVCQTNGLKVRAMDLSNTERVIELVRGLGPDLVSASPPCQDFSSSGLRVEGERAELTLTTAKIMAAVQSRCILIENVPEMLRSESFERATYILKEAGYALIVKRVNATACGVAQVRRRVFLIGMLRCAQSHLQRIDTIALHKTPDNAPTVFDCLCTPHELWWYPPRNYHSPGVRSTSKPAPTLRRNCLTKPPTSYKQRHDDAGLIDHAHILTTEEAALISSFDADWFCGVTRIAAGRLMGNCVPPKMAETMGNICMELLQSPEVDEDSAPALNLRVSVYTRESRVEKLLKAGLLNHGGLRDQNLEYTVGTSDFGDEILNRVLSWLPPQGCRVVVKERGCKRSQPDDVYMYMQGSVMPFRSRAQLERCAGLDSRGGKNEEYDK